MITSKMKKLCHVFLTAVCPIVQGISVTLHIEIGDSNEICNPVYLPVPVAARSKA